VSPVTFRHPSNIARVVASADQISGGRIELGLGIGWHPREHEAHGFAFPAPGIRMDLLEEQLQVIHANWTEGPSSFCGAHYRVSDLTAWPKPIQKPHPPIIIGGLAGSRSTGLAALYATEYNTPFPSLGDIRDRRLSVVEACERVGRPPLSFSVLECVIVGADAADVRRRVILASRAENLDPSRTLANPPAGWIFGTSDEILEKLLTFRDLGVDRVFCEHLLHDDLEAIAVLGSEVAPFLRS
jgi:alkanesulfonate monooxygenase SsuD/methylene tetrahydromethanopterin reductase-like flavin-dependent oxidoreductase (luciferase family)